MEITNYNVIKEIGLGGMAVVYLAHDYKFDTDVAIKVLNKEFVHNENIRKRFISEARKMFKMSHPNIIKVTDLIEEGDTIAFVMEYIEGETLKEYIDRKGKLRNEEIKSLFSQMLDAVTYVHEQNLVHRDIKPSNFMLDKKGQIKLMDFGIAKTTDSSSAEYTQTGTGVQMGTPMYMSPEQITETNSVTAQSDIYSLGVVLWQMVTGQKPYDIKTLSSFQLQTKIVNENLYLTNSKWDNIIQKCTVKIIDNRYINCLELIQELKNTPDKSDINNEDKTMLIDNIDKTVLVQNFKGKNEKAVNNNYECPRCLGKGHVDEKDIKRLKMELYWGVGSCAYCDGEGIVDLERLKSIDADEPYLTSDFTAEGRNNILKSKDISKKSSPDQKKKADQIQKENILVSTEAPKEALVIESKKSSRYWWHILWIIVPILVKIIINANQDNQGTISSVDTPINEEINQNSELNTTDQNGNTFDTVHIGGQVWSSQNLNVDKFLNGDPIQQVKSDNEWVLAAKEQKPVWCYFDNNPANGAKYGKLYNWYAVNDARGLAPQGWHVPNEDEWNQFVNYFGGYPINIKNIKKIKKWNVLLSGVRCDGIQWKDCQGNFMYGLGNHGGWWASESISSNDAIMFDLNCMENTEMTYSMSKGFGYAVRCIKD
jgi:uncharacterized protein (TIGR02145 family)